MTIFSTAAKQGSAAVDSVYGERTVVTPMVNGRASPPLTDPANPDLPPLGTWIDRRRVELTQGDRPGRHFGIDLVGSQLWVSFDLAVFGGVIPVKGWQLQRLEAAGQPLFEVSMVDPGLVRVRLHCVRLAPPSTDRPA